MALEVEKLGFYSNVNYQTFLMPDFSPLGQTRKVLSWLLQHESDTDPELLLKRKFRMFLEKLTLKLIFRGKPILRVTKNYDSSPILRRG